MTREEIYVEKMCKYCKGNCDKGIIVFNNESTVYTKCVDYEKDKSKIEGYKKPIERTAKLQRCIMKGLISDWSK